MGLTQSGYTIEQKNSLAESIPQTVQETIDIHTGDYKEKGQLIYTVLYNFFNSCYPCYSGYCENYIAGITIGYYTYMKTLFIETDDNKKIYEDLILYIREIIEDIDEVQI